MRDPRQLTTTDLHDLLGRAIRARLDAVDRTERARAGDEVLWLTEILRARDALPAGAGRIPDAHRHGTRSPVLESPYAGTAHRPPRRPVGERVGRTPALARHDVLTRRS